MVLGIVVALATLLVVQRTTGFTIARRPLPPEGVDRERVRAEVASKRARGESIAVKSLQTLEWEKQKPGVEFVLRGDAYTGWIALSVVTPEGTQPIGKLGGLRSHRLHIEPEPGNYTYVLSMDEGERTAVVRVEATQLTRVVITLSLLRTEQRGRTVIKDYAVRVTVDDPHPAGPG